MRTRPSKIGRLRRLAGASLLALGLLIGVASAVSAKWWFGYCTDTWLADFGDGTLYTRRVESNPWSRTLIGWHGGSNGDRAATRGGAGRSWKWTWWAFGETKALWEPIQAHSIWPLAPLLTVAGGTLFLFGRRAAKRAAGNQCLKCGYSRAGIAATAACPECGTVPLPPSNPSRSNTLTPTE